MFRAFGRRQLDALKRAADGIATSGALMPRLKEPGTC